MQYHEAEDHLRQPAMTFIDDSAHRRRRNDFDRVAPFYDALAGLVFGGAIKRAQTQLLPELRERRNALVLGGGTGWFLLELLARTDVARVLYVEKSSSMLAKSRELVAAHAPSWLSRVEFRLGTEESLAAHDGPFELVVTNFFLDLFNDPNCAELIERLSALLASDGRWLFVDFHTPEAGWPRYAAKPLYKLMYVFFLLSARIEARRPPHYTATFERLGFRAEREEHFFASMIRAQLLQRRPPEPASSAPSRS